MSFSNKYIEWDIPYDKVQIGVPVGFEVELCQDNNFNEITTRITTFEDNHRGNNFYYSLDGGNTWTLYPFGDTGVIFNQAFKMRLELNSNDSGHINVYNNGNIYRLSSDLSNTIEQKTVELDNIVDSSYGKINNVFYLISQKTIYRYSTRPSVEPYDNSLNINGENVLGIEVDEQRETFWQINRDSVILKNLYGDYIYSIDLDVDIDVDFSSSSSSSSSSEGYSSSSESSSSSSSVGYSSESSSSSSSSEGYSSESSSSSSSEGYSSSSESSSSSSEGYSSSSESSSSSSEGYSSSSESSSSSSEGYSESSESSSSSESSESFDDDLMIVVGNFRGGEYPYYSTDQKLYFYDQDLNYDSYLDHPPSVPKKSIDYESFENYYYAFSTSSILTKIYYSGTPSPIDYSLSNPLTSPKTCAIDDINQYVFSTNDANNVAIKKWDYSTGTLLATSSDTYYEINGLWYDQVRDELIMTYLDYVNEESSSSEIYLVNLMAKINPTTLNLIDEYVLSPSPDDKILSAIRAGDFWYVSYYANVSYENLTVKTRNVNGWPETIDKDTAISYINFSANLGFKKDRY